MEHTNKINNEKSQLIIAIGIWVAIIMLLITIIVIVKNIQEIKTDPIVYGIDKKNFALCSCYDMNGNSYSYNSTGQIIRQKNGWNMNLEN